MLPGVPFPAPIQRTLPDGYGVREDPHAVYVTFGSEDIIHKFHHHVLLTMLEEAIDKDIGKRLLFAGQIRAIVGGEIGEGVA